MRPTILWAIGLACGVVLPLGVALAATEVRLATWASVALGLYLAIRAGTTSAASNWSALSMLAFFLFHTPFFWATLASLWELTEFASWDVRLRWGLVLTALAVPMLTGTVAWLLTRWTLERFDEWVGRPVLGAGNHELAMKQH